MTNKQAALEVAAVAYRARCNGEAGDVQYGHKFDCRIDWQGQKIEVAEEGGTFTFDLADETLWVEIRKLGAAEKPATDPMDDVNYVGHRMHY